MKIKRVVYLVFKLGVRVYIAIATLVGTAVMAWPFIVLGYNGLFAPAPFPIYLPNGFLYRIDFDAPYYSQIITDRNEHKMVMANVKDVMWHKKTVYGFRQGMAKEPYYYICTYGEDCSDTQHLKEADFIHMLKEKGLPAYNYRKAQTYDQLLWEQSKTYKGKGG